MPIADDIKQRDFRNSYQKAFINLVYTANWLETRQKEFFKPFGVTHRQFNILRILRGQYPDKISGAEIKSRMIDQNSDVSRLLDRLMVKKMIDKGQSPDDKRAADVVITQKGLDRLKKIDKEINSLDEILSRLTAEEATQLSDLLDRVRC